MNSLVLLTVIGTSLPELAASIALIVHETPMFWVHNRSNLFNIGLLVELEYWDPLWENLHTHG